MASGEEDEGCTNLWNPKKQKVIETGIEVNLDDRISLLPDSLLIQILSLLPTRYAVTTSILCRRWRSLWTYVHNFDFTGLNVPPFVDYKLSPFGDYENRVNFVDYVLAHSVSPKIKKKNEFNFHDMYKYKEEISRWFSFAVERKVEDVVFWAENVLLWTENALHRAKPCILPESFCTCSSLITLSISSCYFGFDMVILWKSLKSIKLRHMVLSDEEIVNILSGCPALETMELDSAQVFSRLEINSSKLKRLIFKDYFLDIDRLDGRDHSLEIIAPNVQYLEILGDLCNLKCRLVNVSFVLNAKLPFNIECIKDIQADLCEGFDEEEDS